MCMVSCFRDTRLTGVNARDGMFIARSWSAFAKPLTEGTLDPSQRPFT